MRRHFGILPMLVLIGAAVGADAQVQPQLAKRWFEEATKLCERDADGWSVTLNSGWVVRPAARPGSFAIVPEN